MAKSGRQGEKTDERVLGFIAEELFDRPRVKSAQLRREALADPELRPLVPNDRAFRQHVADARARLDSEVWSPATADDEEARLVLPILGKLQREEHVGPDFRLPIRTAKWIARLRRWLPDVPAGPNPLAGEFLMLAIHYADRVGRGAKTDDLDAIVARHAAAARDPYLKETP